MSLAISIGKIVQTYSSEGHFGEETKTSIAKFATSTAGAYSGAKIGATAGFMIAGPAGALVGGLVGSIAGAIIGEYIAEKVYD